MPFGKYRDFEDCVAHNRDKDDPKAYCASIERLASDPVLLEPTNSNHWTFHLAGTEHDHDQSSHARSGSKANPIRTDDVAVAAQALAEGKWVELASTRVVSTFLDQLADDVNAAIAAGANPPLIDLCKVTVPGTNLFCVDTIGVPRIQMPQLTGIPLPGSKADMLPKDDRGRVKVGVPFVEHLQSQGIDVQPARVPASVLKASQNELNGGTVAGIARAIEEGRRRSGTPMFVTRDDYIVDGHHRWAAQVAVELKGLDGDLDVWVVDADIVSTLDQARRFTVDMGIPSRDASEVIAFGTVTDEFHLQGQHDQKTHGNRTGTITATDEAARMAQTINEHARSIEPEITERLANIIGDPDPAVYLDPRPDRGQLHKYEFRLKEPQSIARKIETVMVEKGLTREEAAADIKDAVRYTVHFPDDGFGEAAQRTIDELRNGNTVKVKNSWTRGPAKYKGLNAQITRPDGTRYEVQIHTPVSSAVQERSWQIYAEQRKLLPSHPRWRELEIELESLWTNLDPPPGAEEVLRRREFNAPGSGVATRTTLAVEVDPVEYFAYRYVNGAIISVARILPGSTVTEINNGDGWSFAPILIELSEDPDWEPVDADQIPGLLATNIPAARAGLIRSLQDG
jgi:hypothetical protein